MDEQNSLNMELPPPKTVFIDLHDDGFVDPEARTSEMNHDGVVECTIPTLATPEERRLDLILLERRSCLVAPLEFVATILFFISSFGSEIHPIILPALSILPLLWTAWFVYPLARQIPDTASKKFLKQHYFATLILVVACVLASIVRWKVGRVSNIFSYVLAGATAFTQITLLAAVLSATVQWETDSQRTYRRILKVMCCIATLVSAAFIGESILLTQESILCVWSALMGLLYFSFTGSVVCLLNQTYRDAALDVQKMTDPSGIKSFVVDCRSNIFFGIRCAAYLPFHILFPLMNFYDVNLFVLFSYLAPVMLLQKFNMACDVPLEARRFHIPATPNGARIWVETWLKTYCYSNIVHVEREDANTYLNVPTLFSASWCHVYLGTGGKNWCGRVAVVITLNNGWKMCIVTNRPTELVDAIQDAVATGAVVAEDGDVNH